MKILIIYINNKQETKLLTGEFHKQRETETQA